MRLGPGARVSQSRPTGTQVDGLFCAEFIRSSLRAKPFVHFDAGLDRRFSSHQGTGAFLGANGSCCER